MTIEALGYRSTSSEVTIETPPDMEGFFYRVILNGKEVGKGGSVHYRLMQRVPARILGIIPAEDRACQYQNTRQLSAGEETTITTREIVVKGS